MASGGILKTSVKNIKKMDNDRISPEIILFTRLTRLKASQRHGGAGRLFLHFLVTGPARGRPFSGGVHRNGENRCTNHLIVSGLPDFHGP